MTEHSAAGGQTGRTAAEIREWLLGAVARRTNANPRALDPRERFSRFGVDSMKAAGVTAELSEFLGRPLPRTLLWDHPTIDAVVRHLTGAPAETAPAAAAARPGTEREEPIAVVGLACRFPLAPNPDAFWRLMTDGVDAIREVPKERWDLERYFSADPSAPGRMSTRWGGFLDGVDRFDPQFFGISPREAMQMDPQQRLMLELAWEAFEDAGIVADGLKDSLTGVFVGAMWSDYARLIAGTPSCITQHTATGQDTSIIPARVSYTFGLQGPSVAVNTACSSSLVAVHLACQALRTGEASLALAGAVNLVLAPDSTVAMSKFGGMAPDGRSKAFDARANGYVRGEGGGFLVLKPLSQAVRDGNDIYCVILGGAINNDGFSNGLTAPNPQAQEDMLRLAYARAGVSPLDVDYVETHGTGTLLGDPIEAGAIGRVLGAGRPADRPVLIGSVKTNIGHLEAAAGIAGIIKVALSLRRGRIPGNLHFDSPNPNIDFDGLRLAVQRGGAWPAADRPAIAGVSSFGFGGTNCHIVVRQWPRGASQLLPLAADGSDELRRVARAMRADLDGDDRDLSAICRASAAVLADGSHRAAVTARSRNELAAGLDAIATGESRAGVATGTAGPRPRLVWILSPHGGQWAGMGRQLLVEEPVFRAALQRCAAAIQAETGWDLFDELMADESRSRLADVSITQPAIFAIQVALAELWRSWGVTPDAVIGHSMGEVAAAQVAGVLPLEDAVKVICHRSRLLATTAGKGALAMIGLSADATSAALAGRGDGLWIVAFNSPTSTLVSGESEPLSALLADLERDGVFCRRVKVDVAAHSPHMDPLLDELFATVRGIRPSHGTAQIYSTVEGKALPGRSFDASYWVRNLRHSVLFAQAVDEVLKDGPATFLELGPHPVLAPALQQCLAKATAAGQVVETLHRGEDERAAMLDAAARLYAAGAAAPTWNELLGGAVESAGNPAGLLVLSAHSREALAERAQDVAAVLRNSDGPVLADVCHTAAAHRSSQLHRLSAVARTKIEMAEQLDAFVAEERRPGVSSGERGSTGPGGVAFVFPGQGCQWIGMGRQLLEREPVFRTAIEDCDAAIREVAGWSLLEELAAPPDRSHLTERIDIIQPALCAIQIALAALWRSWGIEPGAVVGHSMGEVAAAHVAGALSLTDAARIICRRSRLLRQVSGKGAMAVVELTLDDAAAALEGYRDRLAVAASNSRRNTVISGEPAALDELTRSLEARGVFCRHVKVDVASHSPQMDPLRTELLAQLQEVAPRAGTVPVYSTVSAEPLDGSSFEAEYWARNLREPVLFSTSVERLLQDGFDTFVEISAHPLLLPAVEELIRDAGKPAVAVPSLRRDEDERASLLGSAGSLFCYGHRPAWDRLNPNGGRLVPLPLYPWQRDRFWLELEARDGIPLSDGAAPSGDAASIIGRALRPAGLGVSMWEFDLTLRKVSGGADTAGRFLTGAELVEMANAAARDVMDTPFALTDMRSGRSIELTPASRHSMQIVIAPEADGLHTLRMLQRDSRQTGGLWHAVLTASVEPVESDRGAVAAIQPSAGNAAVDRFLYDIEWRPAQLAENEAARPKSWLLLGGHAGIAARVAERLEERGGRCLVVEPGLEAEDGPEKIAALASPAAGGSAFDAIVYLQPVDWSDSEDLQAEQIEKSIEAGALDGLRLVQALIRTDLAHTPRLYFVTRGAQAIDGSVNAVSQAPLWGIGSVVAVEHPEFRCTRIDLDQADDDWLVDALSDELEANASDDMVALRGGLRFAASLERCSPGAAVSAAPRASELSGSEPAPFEVDIAADSWRLCLPSSCCAGRIIRVGQAVHEYRVGDEVIADCSGAIGDRVRVGAAFVQAKPSGLNVETARLESLADLVPSLARHAIEGGTPFKGTCLITGGAGGLGLITAAWMVERGARHLVLMGRRQPSAEARKAIDAMTRTGATIRTVAADVTSEAELTRVLDDIDRTMPPLRSVVHAAGVLDDAVVASLDPAKFWNVLRTKARGAWLLHRLTLDRPIDFFVMYSSVLAYLGAAGQANHAAANAFLDALAHFRRSRGLCALSINWGPWSEVGLAAERGGRGDRLAAMGLGSLSPADGRSSLDRVFDSPRAQLSVMPFDVHEWCEKAASLAGTTLFTKLAAESPAAQPEKTAAPVGLRQQLDAVHGGAARRATIESYLQDAVARVLRMSPSSIDPDKPVRSMGLDSLMAIELRNRLEAGTGVSIPTTLIWNYPTVRRLAPEVASRMGLELELADASASRSVAAQAAAVAVDDLPMSEDLEALLGELEELTNDEAAGMLGGAQPVRGRASDV